MSGKVREVAVADAADAVLVVGSVIRLTRLVVADKLGKWWIHDPLNRAMDAYGDAELRRAEREGREPRTPWWWKYADSLFSCPHCLSFHASYVTLGTYRLARAMGPAALGAWRFGAACLTLSSIAGHFSAHWDSEGIEAQDDTTGEAS